MTLSLRLRVILTLSIPYLFSISNETPNDGVTIKIKWELKTQRVLPSLPWVAKDIKGVTKTTKGITKATKGATKSTKGVTMANKGVTKTTKIN